MLRILRHISPGKSNGSKSWLLTVALVSGLIGLYVAQPAQAATYYWDTNSSSGIQSGNGTWDTATVNWSSTTSGSSPLLAWPEDNNANFYASGGMSTVTVNDNQTVGNITFDGSGYILSGGTLTMSGGSITTNQDATIGSVIAGSANLTKLGTGTLTLTGNNTYTGTTTVSAGTLQISAGGIGKGSNNYTYVGKNSGDVGTLSQTGGNVGLSYYNYLTLGLHAGSTGIYNLSGTGLLSASSEYVGRSGAGTFTQTGGTNIVSYLSIGSQGRYQLSGGSLQINGGFVNAGTFDFASAVQTVAVSASSIVDFTQGTIVNAASTSFTIGPNSIVIVPAGFDPATKFGSYSNAGMTHTLGTTLTITAGQTFGGIGTITDPVNCQGSFIGLNGGASYLRGGLTLSGTGTVKVTILSSNDTTSGMSGGSLTTSQQFVGHSGTGNFTQTGGTNNANGDLFVGCWGSNGTYSLSGTSRLVAYDDVVVGCAGTGIFTQTGGTHTIGGRLRLGGLHGSATYNLNGGILSTPNVIPGDSSAALNFSGGTLQALQTFTIPSSANFSLTSGSGGATLDTNGYTLTVNQGITGPGGLTKVGSGTLVLASNNTYAGTTTINVGTLKLAAAIANNIAASPTISINSGATLDVTGLTGGRITLASGQTLKGSGTVTGGVVAANGSHVAPGSSVGTLTVGTLNMANGSVYDYEFNSTLANDRIVVNTSGGLTINGGGFNLYNQGGTTPFATPGTYRLLQCSGAIGGNGTSALSVLNPLPGRTYAFSASTGGMDLMIQPTVPPPPPARPDPPPVAPAPSGSEGLVCVVPGWWSDPSDPSGWANTMKEDIKVRLAAAGESANWVVEAKGCYDPAIMAWLTGSPDPLQGTSLAASAGLGFGEEVKDAGYKKVHFIAHSDGAWFIDAATKKLKELDPTVQVQCTFLDPCVGAFWRGKSTLGDSADYAENYYSTKDLWFTNSALDQAYNFNVTNVAEEVAENADHAWPYKWYGQTVNTVGWQYGDGYGFPLSMEMNGGTLPSISDPAFGGVKVLPSGTAVDELALPLARTDTALDFDNLAMYQSDSGTKMIDGTKLTITTGSPVWLISVLDVTQPVNFLEFQADFTSAAGAEGLLTIYWAGQPIGLIDERWVLDGMQDYVFALPGISNPGTYDLSFRLDPYTETPSSILIDNVATGFVAPEPSTFVLLCVGAISLLAYAWRRRKWAV